VIVIGAGPAGEVLAGRCARDGAAGAARCGRRKSQSARAARRVLWSDRVEELSVTSETVGGTCRVGAAGEIDIATAPELESAFEAALNGAPAAILVDLRAVTFIDSTGMALLLRLIDRAGSTPVRFRISRPIERLLEIIGLEGRIPLADDGSTAAG